MAVGDDHRQVVLLLDEEFTVAFADGAAANWVSDAFVLACHRTQISSARVCLHLMAVTSVV